jgi:hypothetical protein
MLSTQTISELLMKPLESKPLDRLHVPQDYKLLDTRPPREGKSAGKTASSDIYFHVLGCGGNGQNPQREVAALMNQIASQSNRKPKFIVLLGDNFYDNGIDSAMDPAFDTNFYSVYQNKRLTQLAGTPCFVIPGNHDHNLHYWGTRGNKNDFKKIAAQVNHSFLENGVESVERVAMYQNQVIDLAHLPSWNMPRRYYSCTIEAEEKKESNLELFFIDSSTYVKDFLNAEELKSEKENPANQANWLRRIASQNLDAIKLLFLHHPLYTVDKRLTASDAYLYLTLDEIKRLNDLGINGNYNDMLYAILQRHRLKFDATFCAHTHAMSYYYNDEKNSELCQVISGGGGGHLSDRYNFRDRKHLSSFSKKYGFVDVTVDRVSRELTFDYHCIGQPQLRFTNKSSNFVRNAREEKREVTLLREIVTEACELYYDFLANSASQHWSAAWLGYHGTTGSQRTDDVINFFNRYEAIAFADAVNFLKEKMQRWSKANDNSLITYLSRGIFKFCELEYADFEKNPHLFVEMVLSKRLTSPVISRSSARVIPSRRFSLSGESYLSASPWEGCSPKSLVGGVESPINQERKNTLSPR